MKNKLFTCEQAMISLKHRPFGGKNSAIFCVELTSNRSMQVSFPHLKSIVDHVCMGLIFFICLEISDTVTISIKKIHVEIAIRRRRLSINKNMRLVYCTYMYRFLTIARDAIRVARNAIPVARDAIRVAPEGGNLLLSGTVCRLIYSI